MCCSVLQCVALLSFENDSIVLPCVAVRCSALQCVAVCRSALQCVAELSFEDDSSVLPCVAVCSRVL